MRSCDQRHALALCTFYYLQPCTCSGCKLLSYKRTDMELHLTWNSLLFYENPSWILLFTMMKCFTVNTSLPVITLTGRVLHVETSLETRRDYYTGEKKKCCLFFTSYFFRLSLTLKQDLGMLSNGNVN